MSSEDDIRQEFRDLAALEQRRAAIRGLVTRSLSCPSCGAPQPSMHPAVSGGGEVTRLCPDPWHDGDPVTERARQDLAERSERSEDPRMIQAAMLRFYDDDHGPCASYTIAAGSGTATLFVPPDAEEVTVSWTDVPGPAGLAGATDAEVLDAARRLLDRYPEQGAFGLQDLMRAHVGAAADRARAQEART